MGTMNSKLIILHGWTYDTDKWEPFLKILSENGVEYNMLKIPGLTAPLSGVWGLSDYVAWLKKEVGRSREKVILIGHSNGGRIAAAFAALYPERVACLVLIDSAGIIRRDIKTLIKKNLFKIVAAAGKKITKSDKIRDLLYKVVGEQDYNRASKTVKKTMLNLISEDLETTFSKIVVPTLVVWGENDGVTPLSDGRKINSLIKGSEFLIIEGARHSPQFSNKEQVAGPIIGFSKHYGNF